MPKVLRLGDDSARIDRSASRAIVLSSNRTLRHDTTPEAGRRERSLRFRALLRPENARACFVFAHGAGAGMSHPFMETVATGLCDRGVATLRYQFPYMEKGGKRPDAPAVAHAAVRAAVREAARCCAGLPLIAGGKSFGGRMTSQAQAIAPLAGVRGLAFLGFPLHPPASLRSRGPSTFPKSRSRCCSCKAPATVSRR